MPCPSPDPVSQAFIALGSNLEDPVSHIRRAFEELAELPSSRVLRRSSLYRSAPVGRIDQPDFINAVAEMETSLSPRGLLAALLEIERRHGRIREYPNSPRTLDLDVLMYDHMKSDEPDLVLPHPRMHQRAFVLQPLLEIAPDCHIDGHGSAAQLLALCRDQQIERV
ncbi:MAG TPA: 2-amino-4-hydroxy-6-hydroxymethyldihydropteridine diphosphokinase [Nitrosospira sp.]|jgi:2-amino-4-hydroxy-6-hydroxymethyldihydropteridine diphosphokinase|nr:2-amino-4-hydroxy-6-hydroxymethyldihydropteridine diphosphokinase [Nitrosospira sp.]